ncbi:LCP family protein [Brevibacterium jeotgali]|uniref:Transcriptional attenuator, LytR family n=1 Tax=Brevibacterium jeotgali TaxID=1262550 RepID=A0A2H1L835_9MICO|nr:LCP family protein [Brevibacterium jeotgali]TWC03392.1 LytR family transcriptional attenuator [Brevibacterium jeotgali]SMY13056.1 transcriptional attenuator, LytR family [Brevibacterium jeotgali]
MPKIRTALSMLGSAKDAKKFAARFDDPSRNLPAQSLFPPEEVRPPVTDARTILLRVTNTPEGHGDIFAVVHTPVTRDSIAVLVFNPSIVIEAGATLRELVDHSGYPVAVAIVEEFLGTRIDHIVELTAEALTGVIDAVGPLSTYSRAAFSAAGVDFVEGTNRLDGAAARVFTSADPVDDAGQTRTRNQRALLRSLLNTLDVRKLVKDNAQLVPVLDAVVSGVAKDPGFTSAVVTQLAADLRGITRKDIVAVTVPAASERQENGTVRITFEADVLTALRESLTSGSPLEFTSKLAEMGY